MLAICRGITMYDKVKLWIDRAMVGEQYPHIVNYLDEAKTQIDQRTGEVKTFGNIGGLRVAIYIGGIYVTGSIAKYLFEGSNVFTLDRHTTAQAMEKIGDALHIQIDGAKVTGLEFGTNFLMRHPVKAYISRLGEMPRMSRYNFNTSTLYYKGTGKQHPKVFAIYDKIEDAKAKGMDYPDNLNDANVLRYEMRFNGRLATQFNVAEVTASTLYEHTFYRAMVKRYQDIYFSITKQNKIKEDAMREIKTVKDAVYLLFARLMSDADQSVITGFLDELKAAQVFDDSKYYRRVKEKLKDVSTKSNITVSDELIKELDDEIKNCGAYV